MPEDVDMEYIHSTYVDGILQIRMKKIIKEIIYTNITIR
jgi:HSP20 family molecular chaperone IbpA